MKRVFTKYLTSTSLEAVATGEVELEQAYVAQEDILIIGWQLIVELQLLVGVAGNAQARGGFTQGSELGVDATFAEADVGGFGGGGEAQLPLWAVQTVMLPEGYAIPIKEDGVINIAKYVQVAAGETGTIYTFGRIYYVKGKAS